MLALLLCFVVHCKSKETGILQPIFPDYVISCDYGLSYEFFFFHELLEYSSGLVSQPYYIVFFCCLWFSRTRTSQPCWLFLPYSYFDSFDEDDDELFLRDGSPANSQRLYFQKEPLSGSLIILTSQNAVVGINPRSMK